MVPTSATTKTFGGLWPCGGSNRWGRRPGAAVRPRSRSRISDLQNQLPNITWSP